MLPYIAMFLVANTVSHSIDVLRVKGYLSTTLARKIAMIIGMCVCFLINHYIDVLRE